MAFQTATKLNVAGTTLIASGGGFLFVVYSAGVCSFYDTADTSANGTTAANLIASMPAAAGLTQVDFLFKNGLVMTGSGPASVSYVFNG